jgi:formylglycine-generating enzyme
MKRLCPRLALLLATSLPAIAHCAAEPLPPEGQLLVYVDTDAPLPSGPGEIEDGMQNALFDAVRIELVDATTLTPVCTECQRDFDVSRGARTRGISFGVVPSAGSTGRQLRVRFFRRLSARGGEPAQASTLEGLFALPPAVVEGTHTWTAAVHLAGLGRAATVQAMQEGRAAPLSTHPATLTRSCRALAEPGQVCVPGAVFWMHNALYTFGTNGLPLTEQAVAVSPFFLDAHEVTVAELRASGAARSGDPLVSPDQGCSYASAPSDRDDLPVNCVSALVAQAHCAALGKRLPSEAEYELAASAGGRTPFVWGTDEPRCEDAIYLRAPLPGADPFPAPPCAAWGNSLGVAGSGARDALVLGGGRIVDLVGNLSEWTRDAFAAEGEDCAHPGFYQDPVCRPDQGTGQRVAKGGNWMQAAFPSYLRRSIRATVLNTTIGFRCARAGAE